jgi:predicted NBD/HSP70 family sugar kinase
VGAAVSVLNPSRLCFGGGLAAALGDKLLQSLRPRLKEYCLPAHWLALELSLGQLGRDAAVLGAVSLAREELK